MREETAEVSGAVLRFRLTGRPSRLPLLVLENGWGASYDYFSLLEAELAPHAQLLLYNRAGIGGSIAREGQTAEGVSRHLSGLLDHLQVRAPVVAMGQSYGGLICGVHAAQIPSRLCAAVQIDPTPEQADPAIDAGLRVLPLISNLMIVLASLRIPEPLFGPAMSELPPEAQTLLRKHAFGNAGSIRAARRELELLPQLRAASAASTETPRLVISAARTEEIRSPLLRVLVSPERAASIDKVKQALHQATARRGAGSAFLSLPHTHGGIVCTKNGAADTAAAALKFLSELSLGAQGSS